MSGMQTLTIGAPSTTVAMPNATVMYNVTNPNAWAVAIDSFNLSVANGTMVSSRNYVNMSANAFLQPEMMTLALPAANWTNFTKQLVSSIPQLNCSNNQTGCVYNGVCSDIAAKLLPVTVTFMDGIKYMIPAQSYAQDDLLSNVCHVYISMSATNDFFLGMPWFRTFYTTFNVNTQSVTFATGMDSFGGMSM